MDIILEINDVIKYYYNANRSITLYAPKYKSDKIVKDGDLESTTIKVSSQKSFDQVKETYRTIDEKMLQIQKIDQINATELRITYKREDGSLLEYICNNNTSNRNYFTHIKDNQALIKEIRQNEIMLNKSKNGNKLLAIFLTAAIILGAYVAVQNKKNQVKKAEPTNKTDYLIQSTQELTTFEKVIELYAPTEIPAQQPMTFVTLLSTLVPEQAIITTPAVVPTQVSTIVSTMEPTQVPTQQPTSVPTMEPTQVPTANPTVVPTSRPMVIPTQAPVKVEDEEVKFVQRFYKALHEGAEKEGLSAVKIERDPVYSYETISSAYKLLNSEFVFQSDNMEGKLDEFGYAINIVDKSVSYYVLYGIEEARLSIYVKDPAFKQRLEVVENMVKGFMTSGSNSDEIKNEINNLNSKEFSEQPIQDLFALSNIQETLPTLATSKEDKIYHAMATDLRKQYLDEVYVLCDNNQKQR